MIYIGYTFEIAPKSRIITCKRIMRFLRFWRVKHLLFMLHIFVCHNKHIPQLQIYYTTASNTTHQIIAISKANHLEKGSFNTIKDSIDKMANCS